jgi:proteic killer suppression protein
VVFLPHGQSSSVYCALYFDPRNAAAHSIRLDVSRLHSYNHFVIRSFRNKEAEKIFHRERSRKLPSDIQQVALRKLRMLNRAITLQDLRVPPANRLERLTGQRTGQYGIRINDQMAHLL